MKKLGEFKKNEKNEKIILAIEFIVLIIILFYVTIKITNTSENINPIAIASADITSGLIPLNVNFQGSGTDSDGIIVSYFWDFGDGLTSKSQNPTHTYQIHGKFTVTFTVTDNKGDIGRNKIIIDVIDNTQTEIKPVNQQEYFSDYIYFDFTWNPQYPDVGEKTTFRIVNYYGGITLSKIWNFGDGSIGWGSVVSHTYTKKGRYRVSLSVSGREFFTGEYSSGYKINYIEIGASPFPRFTWSPKEPTVGEKINFDASQSTDVNGKIVKYSWSYTEASKPNTIINMGNNKSFTYTFNKQGNYKVKLAVTDNENNTNELTKTVVVSILSIKEIIGGYRNFEFQITNRGNITAENINWKVFVNRNLLFIPLWKIFSKKGTLTILRAGETRTIDVGRYRRGFGRITVTIIAEGSNAVKITRSQQGFMFSKFIHLRL